MHYLIDGHNLIGKMPDIKLDDPDDEVKLVLRLRSWAAGARSRHVTVVFDHGLPGGTDRGLSTSKVQVVFASGGRTADAILINRINRVGNPREYTAVSSDNHILQRAAKRRMPAIKSEEFALKITRSPAENEQTSDLSPAPDTPLSAAEVNMWLDLFGAQDD